MVKKFRFFIFIRGGPGAAPILCSALPFFRAGAA